MPLIDQLLDIFLGYVLNSELLLNVVIPQAVIWRACDQQGLS